MNFKKLLKKLLNKFNKIGLVVLFCILLYTSYNAIIQFYQGYHALDLAFNFLNLGYTTDKTLNNSLISLESAYLTGLNLIKWGFYWLIFDIILSFLFGYFLSNTIKLKGGSK